MASTSQQPQFVDFPTPNRLLAAQRVYASKVKKTPPMNNNDGSPNLLSPHITKDQIFDKNKFVDIDRRSSKVSLVRRRYIYLSFTYRLIDATFDPPLTYQLWISNILIQ
jgi:hypothetical protein